VYELYSEDCLEMQNYIVILKQTLIHCVKFSAA